MTVNTPEIVQKESLSARLARPAGAAAIMLVVLIVMVGLEVFDAASPLELDRYGIAAQEPEGLLGIFSAPFLHAGFGHLWSNAIPLFVMGFLTIIGGLRQAILATLGIAIVSGLFAWAFTFGEGTQYIIGASGVVFGLLTYLLTRGIFNRNFMQIAIAVVVLLMFGGILLGVLPTSAGVSWQGHLGGAIGGVLMAFLLARGDRAKRRAQLLRS